LSERSVVIDTSALVASHEREQHAELGRLHARASIIAPALLAYEVGQVIHAKKPSAFEASASERADLVSALLGSIDLITPDDDSLRRSGELAEKERLSFYDASFLELAISRDASILTEDDKLAKIAIRVLGPTRVMRMTR